MLTNLHVKNLALIDEAEVEFGPGLNILTGETGAGKSILIGSINAALGKKISREMIRRDTCMWNRSMCCSSRERFKRIYRARSRNPSSGRKSSD